MVDEGSAIDASLIVLAEYHVYSFSSEQADKLLPVTMAAVHGKCHIVPYLRLPFPGFVFAGIVTNPFFQPLVAVAFSDKGGLDRSAQRFACIIRHGIDNAVIGCTLEIAPDLFYLNIEAGKQCAVLAERLETVAAEYTFYNVGNLFLHIPVLVVRFL